MVLSSDDETYRLKAEGETLAVSALSGDEGVGVLSASDDPGIIIISAVPPSALRSELGRFLDEHPDLSLVVVDEAVGPDATKAVADVAGAYGLSVDDGT